MIIFLGGVDPSSPPGPQFEDEADELLGNNDLREEEEEGEELFGDNFERCAVYMWIGPKLKEGRGRQRMQISMICYWWEC